VPGLDRWQKGDRQWRYQAPTTFTAAITPGKHDIKIQHFEIDGYAALTVEVKKS